MKNYRIMIGEDFLDWDARVSNIIGQKFGILITVAGKCSKIEPENQENFTFKELYGIIGCDEIEILDSHLEEGIILLCDADLPNDAKINYTASAIVGYGIRGNAVCCDAAMIL